MTAAAAPHALDRVPRLTDRRIVPGERWIYSAGFNVPPDLRTTARIDEELADLNRLARAGARVTILSHQGPALDGAPGSLRPVAPYLASRLGRPVRYVDANDDRRALAAAQALRPGEIALMANTRTHAGEVRGDPHLARRFAQLGDQVAVGGFSKAHRSHSSNVGILQHRRGFATAGLLRELEQLEPWIVSRATTGWSVAAVGGVKREKLELALPALAAAYDAVIPGGAVLNALLQATGVEIGGSELGQCGGRKAELQQLLHRHGDRIHLPGVVVTAPASGEPGELDCTPVPAGVPGDRAIVDFVLPDAAQRALDRLSAEGGRALLAGPLGRGDAGSSGAAHPVLQAFRTPSVQALLMGGDTLAELPWDGPTSSGGGSALTWLTLGSLPVIDALINANRKHGS